MPAAAALPLCGWDFDDKEEKKINEAKNMLPRGVHFFSYDEAAIDENFL